jgi:carbamoyl-phosphate synthase small subunit
VERRLGERRRTTVAHIVAIDYGVKRNILRLFSGLGCKVTVVPATMSAEDILAMAPDGVFLSNGPGDPAATGEYAVPVIRKLIDSGIPIFGICLGHQILALALGGTTVKMHQGHHGANHPVKDHTTGKVEIVSMNHGFAVDAGACPKASRRPTSRCSTAPIAVCGWSASRCSRSSITRKPRPARRTATICSAAS